MWAQFTTTLNGNSLRDTSLVQNWLQMEGSEPGKYTGFTCTAEYNTSNDYQPNPRVINYENIDSLRR